MNCQTIIVTKEDHVATLPINRPGAINSFTMPTLDEFAMSGGIADKVRYPRRRQASRLLLNGCGYTRSILFRNNAMIAPPDGPLGSVA